MRPGKRRAKRCSTSQREGMQRSAAPLHGRLAAGGRDVGRCWPGQRRQRTGREQRDKDELRDHCSAFIRDHREASVLSRPYS